MLDVLRELLKAASIADWPAPACPTCHRGQLQIEGDLNYQTSRESEDEQSSYPGAWDPMWVYGVFSGMLRCNNKPCADRVAFGGEWFNDPAPTPAKINNYDQVIRLKFAFPPLALFRMPPKTPKEVQESMRCAATVIWSDPDSAANRLREAVERLLDHRRIRKFNQNKQGKRLASPRNLKARIDDLKTQPRYSQVADLFDALRLRGNIGTHGSGLDVDAVLDMATVLELALRLLYDKSDVATVRLAKEMVARKGKP